MVNKMGNWRGEPGVAGSRGADTLRRNSYGHGWHDWQSVAGTDQVSLSLSPALRGGWMNPVLPGTLEASRYTRDARLCLTRAFNLPPCITNTCTDIPENAPVRQKYVIQKPDPT